MSFISLIFKIFTILVSILANVATDSRAKAASKGKTRRKAQDQTHWPQLPKISNNAVPVECKSLLVTRDTSITNISPNIDKQRSQKCKKKKYKVLKSSSDTLVARLGALSIRFAMSLNYRPFFG